MTPLLVALKYKHLNIVKFLAENEAYVNHRKFARMLIFFIHIGVEVEDIKSYLRNQNMLTELDLFETFLLEDN